MAFTGENDRRERVTLLASVFLIALSGLAYELLAGTLSAYLVGNTILQFSLAVGIFMSAMGAGSFLSQKVTSNLLDTFVLVEIGISALGGASALILFLTYAYTTAYYVVLLGLLFSIGLGIGLELPILIRIIKDYGELRVTLANLLAWDYLGALGASLLFPMLILPHMGLMQSSFFFGLLNAAVVFGNLHVFGNRIRTRRPLFALASVVSAALLVGLFYSFHLVGWIESRLYDDEIILTRQTKYQRIVVTRWKTDLRLYLDGDLQFSSEDEYRYHEALVQPPMGLAGSPQRILILGGGDGLAIRELLKYPKVKEIRLVDIDPEMVRLCREDPLISRLNEGALASPKVTHTPQDAFKFLERNDRIWDVILVDLPDPNNEALCKLYTKEFYSLARHRLASNGALCVQSTSPHFVPRTFWCIQHTVQAAGFFVKPFHVYVPSFGDWGFALAALHPYHPEKLAIRGGGRFLRSDLLGGLFSFGNDMAEESTEINRLDHPILLQYYLSEWKRWD
ncbi:MAG: polyamine aminopropyltransferase [Armatimonadetes bacterium]|nr:polyamine aminopropyltransferase [Armatimonadota bacterium]